MLFEEISYINMLQHIVKLTFFLSILKLSMITPMNRLRVKNDPQTMNITK